MRPKARPSTAPGGSTNGSTPQSRSFTPSTTSTVIPLPRHDHALLEFLYKSVFEQRFINTTPTCSSFLLFHAPPSLTDSQRCCPATSQPISAMSPSAQLSLSLCPYSRHHSRYLPRLSRVMLLSRTQTLSRRNASLPSPARRSPADQ